MTDIFVGKVIKTYNRRAVLVGSIRLQSKPEELLPIEPIRKKFKRLNLSSFPKVGSFLLFRATLMTTKKDNLHLEGGTIGEFEFVSDAEQSELEALENKAKLLKKIQEEESPERFVGTVIFLNSRTLEIGRIYRKNDKAFRTLLNVQIAQPTRGRRAKGSAGDCWHVPKWMEDFDKFPRFPALGDRIEFTGVIARRKRDNGYFFMPGSLKDFRLLRDEDDWSERLEALIKLEFSQTTGV